MNDAIPAPADRKRSPRELLELAANEHRGKLKIFLGMAPGVGKTYAMLSMANALSKQGVDVVVGLVETHGRSETAALLEGLEVLARRPITYRRHTLMEFDIDAAIARKPELLLVDEFAHTNAPGLIHAKRFQDVEGVLQAGIDVWTTLNIQHLESLNDVVARITGITVSETVPDRVLEKADEIVVVDLPPEELIQRLKEGKVYLPDNARRAVDQFFRLGNLTALRELALRRTADRVDEQVLEQMREQGIEGPSPASERLLVVILGDDMSETVVRAAGRIAQAQKCEWIAASLSRSDRENTDASILKRSDKAVRLAERLGATSVRLRAKDLIAEVLSYARRNNISQIVVGRAPRMGWRRLIAPPFADALARNALGIAVTFIPGGNRRTAEGAPELPRFRLPAGGVIAAVATVTLALILCILIERAAPVPNLNMIFLLAVLVSAVRFGVGSAVIAAFLSFIAYNFFFIEPRYTLTVAQPFELLSLFIFLAVAIATGSLAGRLREQSEATHERAELTQALYDFSRKLSRAAKRDDVLWLLAAQGAAAVKGRAVVMLLRDGTLALEASWPPDDDVSTADWAAAKWAYEKRQAAGRGTDTMPSASYQFRPLMSTTGPLGVVGVAREDGDEPLSSASEDTLQAFIDQSAVAMERTLLVQRATEAETAAKTEQLRASLLSSVSHDLKTPLAAIVGAASSLRELGEKMTKKTEDELLATIEEEAQRLSSFVANLLDMTRIEAGALDIGRDLIDVGDAVRNAIGRARTQLPARRLDVKIEDGLPPVRGDAALLQQVVFNLLDNADKYAGKGSATRVEARRERDQVVITVTDEGVGIPKDALKKVFDKFYRVSGGAAVPAADGRAAGTGLGLSIAAGILKAMQGTIRAESPVRDGKGARLIVSLPIGEERARVAESGS